MTSKIRYWRTAPSKSLTACVGGSQLLRYYQMKRKHPNLCRADNLHRLDTMMAAQMHGVLAGRDKDGCRVITVKIGGRGAWCVWSYLRPSLASSASAGLTCCALSSYGIFGTTTDL